MNTDFKERVEQHLYFLFIAQLQSVSVCVSIKAELKHHTQKMNV